MMDNNSPDKKVFQDDGAFHNRVFQGDTSIDQKIWQSDGAVTEKVFAGGGSAGRNDGNAPQLSGLQKIEFSGTGKEYFGIWIVNIVLTILTLGIYSAWAKVRRETYFKNNTKIMGSGIGGDIGSGFGYHATGGQILKGRALAFMVLILVNIAITYLPGSGLYFFIAFVFILPWLLNNSIRFAARMTSFNNIRFNWHGTYAKTLWFLIIMPYLGLLTFGMLTPFFARYYYQYFATSHSYGTTRFDANPTTAEYYNAFLMGILSCFVMTLFLFGFLFCVLAILGDAPSFNVGYILLDTEALSASLLVFLLLGLIILMFFIFLPYKILCRNIMLRNMTLSDVASFGSTLKPMKYIWILFSNVFFIVLSFALLLPWAKVRMYRYLTDNTQIDVKGDWGKFMDDAQQNRSAFGEEFAEFESVDISI